MKRHENGNGNDHNNNHERIIDDEEANAIDALNEEDMPERVPNAENLPQLNKLEIPEDLKEAEQKGKKKGKDGVDKAMEMIDKYYEGTPVRDHRFDHGGE